MASSLYGRSLIAASIVWSVGAWTSTQAPKPSVSLCRRVVSSLAVSTSSTSEPLQQSTRDVGLLLEWALSHGVETNNLALQETESLDGCFGVTASAETPPMTNVLKVPRDLILSSERIRRELETSYGEAVLPAIEYVKCSQYRSQLSQFFLLVKILQEYIKGEDSLWGPWLQSVPRNFDTAIAMSEEELEWLPPFAWALGNVERKHLVVFREALQKLPDFVLPTTVQNDDDLTKWAFQVVFTRAWRYPKEEEEENVDGEGKEVDERCDIVPFGDMFNHCSEKDLELDYDDHDNFLAYTAHEVTKGTPLHISYGRPTNPYRFLTVFGFCDTGIQEIFSQITLEKPTKQHQTLGYDIDTMVFRTKDGAISNAVWDVLLFSILEQKPELQTRFYDAHQQGDANTKSEIHERFHLETCLTLKSHVDRTYSEMREILNRMELVPDNKKKESPRFELIRRNNKFVFDVFAMVKQRVDGMIQAEVLRRRPSS